jgi:hypothetical protein
VGRVLDRVHGRGPHVHGLHAVLDLDDRRRPVGGDGTGGAGVDDPADLGCLLGLRDGPGDVSVIRCPSGAVKTIWALAPEASGSVLLRLSNARCDSVPGTEKRSSSLPPKTPTHVMSAASTNSHIPRTSLRCR